MERTDRLQFIKAQWHLQMMTMRKEWEIQWKLMRLQESAESAGVKAGRMSAREGVMTL